MRADVGIALDGDADRMVLVDEQGRLVDGDQVMAVVAQSWQEEGRLAKPGIVATIMSNFGLEKYLGCLASLARTAVGDRYVLEHMRGNGFNVGGEQSGHVILSDYCTTGDGLVAAMQVMAVVKRRGKPSAKSATLRPPAANIEECALQGRQAAGAAGRLQAIAAAKEKLGNDGRLVIRPSGTEPVIRVMAEGDDRQLVEQVVEDICEAVAAAA